MRLLRPLLYDKSAALQGRAAQVGIYLSGTILCLLNDPLRVFKGDGGSLRISARAAYAGRYRRYYISLHERMRSSQLAESSQSY